MLSEKRIRKYLVYAIGEIVLVVIGILIALQINLMMEARNLREQELETLDQLKAEFEDNLHQLDEKISMREAMLESAMRLLAMHDDPSLIEADTVEVLLARTTVSPTFDPINSDLITSGRLYLITNPDLRRALSRWTSDVAQITEEEQSWITTNRQLWQPFLSSRYPRRNIRAAKWSGLDVVKTLMLDKTEGNDLWNLSRSARKPDLEALFGDPQFEDLASAAASNAMFANRQSQTLRKSIVEILRLTKAELEDQ